jgi:DNA-binding MarR family transcriptional regulator
MATPELIPEPDRRESEMQELRLAFRRVFRSLNRMRGRDTHLGGKELSNAQVELLSELYERGALPAGELAAAAGLTPGTVTQMLDHLAACGHVERDRSLQDRRVVLSHLTPQGRRRIQAKKREWQGRWEEALQGVEEADIQAATRVLARLGEMVESKAPQACARPAEGASAGPPQVPDG